MCYNFFRVSFVRNHLLPLTCTCKHHKQLTIFRRSAEIERCNRVKCGNTALQFSAVSRSGVGITGAASTKRTEIQNHTIHVIHSKYSSLRLMFTISQFLPLYCIPLKKLYTFIQKAFNRKLRNRFHFNIFIKKHTCIMLYI